MDLTAKVIMELPETGGVSQRGNQWRKKSWILETFGPYPKKVKVDAMNAQIDNLGLQIGKTYTVSVDAESREFNDRWYTDLRAFSAREVQEPNGAYPAAPAPAAPASVANDPFAGASADPFAPASSDFKDESDDLPF